MIYKEFYFLPFNRIGHSASCLKLANTIMEKNAFYKVVGYELLNMALYHDIGYSTAINKLNFHSVDGAAFLENKLNIDIVTAIAHHGGAEMLMKEHENKDEIEKLLKRYNTWNLRSKMFLEVINFIDAHVDGKGNIVTIEERYSDIANRYSQDSIQVRTFVEVANNIPDLKI